MTEPKPLLEESSSRWTERLYRFSRTVLTGGLATFCYFAVYLPLFKVFGMPQSLSDDIGLTVGAVVQFVGCRYYVFRAQGRGLARQLVGFAVAEAFTLLANIGLLRFSRSALPPEFGESSLLALATTFVVFVGFSYPVWHWVFADPRPVPPGDPTDRYTGPQ